jgi:hypothetical protein
MNDGSDPRQLDRTEFPAANWRDVVQPNSDLKRLCRELGS